MTQITIRPAAGADIEHVLPLVEDFVASFELDHKAYRTTFQRLVGNPNATILVAESDGEIVAYCLGFTHDTFYANGPVAWLEEIMVAQAYRRTGLGADLMKAFEGWARNQGAVLCALATRRAADFYEAIGYQASASYYRKLL